ncbi:hypothetical protein ONZ43_g888 [Nemania bipapillata]|uniref:Uncharacterized protein n=1 Tax=Nemania bipapillata TaxID=110536 RepID=A0ACC2J6L3_9PEZI|nr:hypothetical protein ONZ43_g888 [Nemania bipapillata]
MDTNTLAENFGGKADDLATHQFSLDDVPDLSGKFAVVTGGSEGIGYGVTHTLLKHNIARVYILSVSKEVVDGATEAIQKELGKTAAKRTEWFLCDLADWKRTKEVADEIKRDTDTLDILVNNAGRGVMTYQLTDYGVDRHMAVNHMGHVVLTSHLLPLMGKTAERGTIVRIVNQASNAHRQAPSNTRFEDLEELNQNLGPISQYGRSKLANMLYSRYFTRKVTRAGQPNILMNSTHPGVQMSRNAALSPSAARRPSNWTSHLRQFSKSSTDKLFIEPSRSPDTASLASNSTIRDFQSSRRASERIYTVTINESLARDEVLLNFDLIGGSSIQPGTLMSITPIKADTDRSDRLQGSLYGSSRPPYQRTSAAPVDTRANDDDTRRYVFIAKDMPKDLKARMPNVEVYVAKHVGDAFSLRKGTQVVLAPVDNSSPAIEASHVELSFKDMYLSRSDMWKLAVADLADRTVYRGQVIYFLGSIKATVTTVFVDGRKFDSDGSGEIMFYKVVNGFLPALFKKWEMLQVKHLVSIVLFARVEYDVGLTTDLANTALYDNYYTGFQTSGNKRPYKDFYRVVMSEISNGEWTKILDQLKKEFNVFRRDINIHHREAMTNAMEIPEDSSVKGTSISKIKAEPSAAMYGNFLEAINLASSIYASDYVDRDLLRTGISIVLISPGPGVFEVEYETLRRTTEALPTITVSNSTKP